MGEWVLLLTNIAFFDNFQILFYFLWKLKRVAKTGCPFLCPNFHLLVFYRLN